MATMMDEELIPLREAFRPMTGADRKYEKCLYYRHPDVWSPGAPEERKNARAGWIIWAGNNRDRMADMMERGFVPLRKFGIPANHQSWEQEAQGTADQYGPWGAILTHPEGPAAFPIEQILVSRWYDPKHCPVPGVVFPQLAGTEIVEYACPDCTDRNFGLALHLARHLRLQHEWTVDDLVKFGEAMGLDFRREFSKQAKRVVPYPAGDEPRQRPTFPSAAKRKEDPPVRVDRVVPVRTEAAEKPKPVSPAQARARAEAGERLRALHAARRAARAAS